MTTEFYYVCERCDRAVDANDFLTLAKDERYNRSDYFFIFHTICVNAEEREGRKFHIHKQSGNLALVERIHK